MISEWERNKREPAVKFIPKIVEFLGYVPFDRGETLGERIRIYRKTLGLSHYEFARQLVATGNAIRLPTGVFINTLSFALDGNRIAGAYGDGKLRIWKPVCIVLGSTLAYACTSDIRR